MVTWARVLAGRWRDPLVGRDLLVVVAFVTLNYLFQRVVGSFAGWYLDPGTEFVAGADFGLGLDTLLGGRIMAARMAASLLTATSVTFTFFAVLLAAKTVLKRPWTVVVVLFALWGPVGGATRIVEGDWASVVQWVLEIGFLFFLMMRYGLFAATVFSALSQLIDWSILTSNFGAWYGQSSLVATVVLVAVALYGFYAALGGRPVAALVDEGR
jgi:hypothetical protein